MRPHTTKYNGWLPAASVAAVPEIAPCSSQSPAVRKSTTHGTTLSLSPHTLMCTHTHTQTHTHINRHKNCTTPISL